MIDFNEWSKRHEDPNKADHKSESKNESPETMRSGRNGYRDPDDYED